MKINPFNRFLTALLLALLMLALVGVALADPDPQSVTWRATVTLYTGNGVTASLTGTAATKPAEFGVQDCYQIIDVTALQTVTGKLEHSPDGLNWVTLQTFSAVSADNVAFTRTTIYGGYERYLATLGTTNPVTITLKCVAKNNG